ncbi:MAG: hypothetical protein ACE5EG_01165 [Thermoanaerobaculia bacterium]
MRRKTRPLAFLVAAVLLTTAAARAQTFLDLREQLDFDRPEAWAMKYFGSVALPAGLGVPETAEPGSVYVGFEAGWVPSLSAAERTVGFVGSKTEHLNRTPVFGRPWVRVALPAKLSLTLGLVPPLELNGVEPLFVSLALGRPLREAARWRLGGRLFAQHGTLEGDLTCSAAEVGAGLDPTRNRFFCEEPSQDEMTLRTVGGELGVAWQPARRPRLEPHLALAVSRLDLELQVRARYSGVVDRSLLTTDGTTVALTAGVTWRSDERSRLDVDLFYSPLDVSRPPFTGTENDGLFNVRVSYGYRLR